MKALVINENGKPLEAVVTSVLLADKWFDHANLPPSPSVKEYGGGVVLFSDSLDDSLERLNVPTEGGKVRDAAVNLMETKSGKSEFQKDGVTYVFEIVDLSGEIAEADFCLQNGVEFKVVGL